MRITFKLFATLAQYLPREHDGHVRTGNELPLELPDGTTLEQVVEKFPMPRALVHLVLVNGEFILPADRARHVLHDGDAVAIWPPIAGG